MPQYIAPGIYIEQPRTGGTPIESVPTSVTAFVGRTRRGPADSPRSIVSFAEFERLFGALSPACPMPYAVQQYFANGGKQAVIVRVRNGARAITDAQISNPGLQAAQRGLWALERIDAFNLLCIPPLSFARDVGKQSWDAAARYCAQRGALLLIDAPRTWRDAAAALGPGAVEQVVQRSHNAALYFPRIVASDPLAGAPNEFAPCGAVAGVIARTDLQRGVWKAPAGTDATLLGVLGLSAALHQHESEELNSIGVNALRTFPQSGHVVFGARTLAANTAAEPQFKYVPLRRLQLHIEASLRRGLDWVAFEANGEALWVRVRRAAEDFLLALWRAGAFQGASAEQGFFVRCDRGTMTQADIEQGRVNVIVGFAPLKPAEFVILNLHLLAAAAST